MPLPRNILGTDSKVGSTRGLSGQQAAIWGRIIGAGPAEDRPSEYEWEEVFQDDKGEWQSFADKEFALAPANDSILSEDSLFNPAVEINGAKARVGSIVRLVPDAFVIAEPQNVSHRRWLFSITPELRPFILADDLIPDARDPGAGDRDLYRTIKGEFIDRDILDTHLESVTLYPAHSATWTEPAEDDEEPFTFDQFVSLGFAAWGGGNSFAARGTMGWAQYKAHGTRIGYNDDGSLKWRGEWQIVTLYADQVAQLKVITAAIEPGDVGKAHILLMSQPPLRRINSRYEVEVFNDLKVPLAVDTIFKAEFSRLHYIFHPISVPSGSLYAIKLGGINNLSGDVSRAFDFKSCDFEGNDIGTDIFELVSSLKPNMDTALFPDYVVRYEEQADGTLVIVSDIWDDPIGTVKMWNNAGALRDGWRKCGAGADIDFRTGRFAKYPEGAEVAGDSGGLREFNVSLQADADHITGAGQTLVDGIDEQGTGPSGGDWVDNNPLWTAIWIIERFE